MVAGRTPSRSATSRTFNSRSAPPSRATRCGALRSWTTGGPNCVRTPARGWDDWTTSAAIPPIVPNVCDSLPPAGRTWLPPVTPEVTGSSPVLLAGFEPPSRGTWGLFCATTASVANDVARRRRNPSESGRRGDRMRWPRAARGVLRRGWGVSGPYPAGTITRAPGIDAGRTSPTKTLTSLVACPRLLARLPRSKTLLGQPFRSEPPAPSSPATNQRA
jgi:hypothetical protein